MDRAKLLCIHVSGGKKYLGGSVSYTVEGETGCSWADGDEGSNDISNPDGSDAGVSVGGGGDCESRDHGDGRELHLERFRLILLRNKWWIMVGLFETLDLFCLRETNVSDQKSGEGVLLR